MLALHLPLPLTSNFVNTQIVTRRQSMMVLTSDRDIGCHRYDFWRGFGRDIFHRYPLRYVFRYRAKCRNAFRPPIEECEKLPSN